MSQARNRDVDVLRGVAILMIVVVHCVLLTPGVLQFPRLINSVQRLSTGVELFFVLSGFLIAASLDRSLLSGEGLGGYFARRFAKIVPLYLIFLALNFLAFEMARVWAPSIGPLHNSLREGDLTAANLTVHLLFLQGMTPALMHTLLDGSWSIVCEVYFYVIYPLALATRCADARGALRTYCWTLVLALVFIVLIGRRFDGYSTYGFPAQLPVFLLGVLGQRLTQIPGFTEKAGEFAGPAMVAIGLLMVGTALGDTKPLGLFHVWSLFFLGLLLTMPAIRAHISDRVSLVLQSFGRQSYAIFFAHLWLLKGLYVIMAATGASVAFGWMLALNCLVGIGLSWGVSYAVFDPIDRLCVARVRCWVDRSKTRIQHWRTE